MMNSTTPPSFDIDRASQQVFDELDRLDSLGRGPDEVLVGVGVYCGFEGYARVAVVGLWRGQGATPRELWQGYVPCEEVAALGERLGERAPVQRGGLDFYHATDWELLWTRTGRRFRLYSRAGLLLELGEERLLVWDMAGVVLSLDRQEIREIEPRVAPGGGRLVAVGDCEEWEIYSRIVQAEAFDPTYDGIDMLGDAMWLVELARELAGAL